MTPTSMAIVAATGGVLSSAHAEMRFNDPSCVDRDYPLASIYRPTVADR